MKSNRFTLAGLIAAGALLAACSGAPNGFTPSGSSAQSPAGVSDAGRAGNPPSISVGFDDVAAATALHIIGVHMTPTTLNDQYGKAAVPDAVPIGYPLDVTRGKGRVATSISAYDVYVNCKKKNESCWGRPEEFLKALTGSSFLGMITQYTGGPASDYAYAASLAVSYKPTTPNSFDNDDISAILTAAVKHFGKIGITAEYHIFLPSGTNTCFGQTGTCYSPNNLSTFTFCGYHAAASYKGKALLYSVEPYQNVTVRYKGATVFACGVQKVPAGINRLNSATASTLEHESFGTWSDPEPDTGWFNQPYQIEIPDVCTYRYMDSVPLGSATWYIQQIYSNAVHGCASQ